jgi:hypothetical protein
MESFFNLLICELNKKFDELGSRYASARVWWRLQLLRRRSHYEDRQPERDELTHHSDRRSQHVSIRHSERLAEAGIKP